MALDERTLRFLAAQRMSPDAAERYASRPGAGGYVNPDRPTLARVLQDLGGIGGPRVLIPGIGGGGQTINVNAGSPPPPAGAAKPSTPDESALASQAGWAGANEAVAPYLGDWRATPAQILAAAVGGYNRSRYAAQQDIAAQRQQQQLFDLKKQEMDATAAESQAKAAQRQSVMDEIKKLPPGEQTIALLDPEGWAAAKARQSIPEPISAFQEASLGLQRDRMAQEAQEAAQRIALQRRQVELAGRADAEPLVAVQTPDGPRLLPRSKAAGMAPASADEPLVSVQTPDGPRLMPRSQAAGLPPADTREAGASFNQAKDLRTAFDKQAQDIRDVSTAYRKIDAGFKEESGPGDIAGIFGFMKMLDPTSVVREGEFATAANSGGVPDWLRVQYNKLLTGEKLTGSQREEILSAAGSQLEPYRTRYNELTNTYTGLANQFQLDPANVITGVDIPNPERPGQTMMNKTGAQEQAPTVDNGAPSPAAQPPKAPVLNADDLINEFW